MHKVLAGSPADRDGRIQKGDRIISINGRSMKGLTHKDSLNILKVGIYIYIYIYMASRGEPRLEFGVQEVFGNMRNYFGMH